MPPRKQPLLPAVVGESVGLGEQAALVASIRRFIDAHPATMKLGAPDRDRMAVRIADACQFAQLDLGCVLAGKSAKPDAWRGDVFCADVAVAWGEAFQTKQQPPAWEEGDKSSPFVRFANDLAAALKLKLGRASLVNSVKRGRKIERL